MKFPVVVHLLSAALGSLVATVILLATRSHTVLGAIGIFYGVSLTITLIPAILFSFRKA